MAKRRLLSYAVLKSEKGVSYSKQHLKRLEEAGEFPRRVPIGGNRYCYVESEVDAWLEQKIAARDAAVAA
jgi:prophage regulatory protein